MRKILLIILLPIIAQAQAIKIYTSYNKDINIINFAWEKEHQVNHETISDSEVLFTFAEAINIKNYSALQPSFSLVSEINVGYDSILINTKENVKYKVIANKKGFSLKLLPNLKQNKKLNVDLAKSRLLLQTGKITKAFKNLDNLVSQYPNSPSLLIARAEAENRIGRWRKALYLLDLARDLDPENKLIDKIEASIIRPYEPYVAVDHQVEFTGDNLTERMTNLTTQTRVSDSSIIGLSIDRNEFSGKNVARANGLIEDINKTKYKSDIYIIQNYKDGDRSRFSIFLGDRITGFGADYIDNDKLGSTKISAELNKPYWGFQQGVIDRGSRSRILANRVHNLSPNLTANITPSLNSYGINGKSNIASSFQLGANFSYNLPFYNKFKKMLGYNGYMSLNYTLDGEYPFSVKEYQLNGVNFTPLPLGKREIHTVDLNLAKEIIHNLLIEIYGGYSIDRFGGRAPSYGAKLIRKIKDKLELSIGFRKTLSFENSNDEVTIIGVNLRWLF